MVRPSLRASCARVRSVGTPAAGASFVFLGAPGVGKGTFAKLFCDSQQWSHLSIGDLMRAEVKQGSAIGRRIKDSISAGRLVPDELANEIAFGFLAASRGDFDDLSLLGVLIEHKQIGERSAHVHTDDPWFFNLTHDVSPCTPGCT